MGQPNLRSDFEELLGQYNPGDAITISIAVDVPPSLELADYNNSQALQAEEIAYQPEKVDDFIRTATGSQKADLVPVEDRPAEMGDVAFRRF